jgi:purine-binding chemotaxis protein CheW
MPPTEEEQRETGSTNLFLFRAGGRLMALFSSNVDCEIKWTPPVPIPRAPAAVLGVVSARGRIFTVLDPLTLLGDTRPNDQQPAAIITLTGDEQLALAIDRSEPTFQIEESDLSASPGGAAVVTGTVTRAGEQIILLDAGGLFSAAMKGVERRRKRSRPVRFTE